MQDAKLEHIRQSAFKKISSCPVFAKCAPFIGPPHAAACDFVHEITAVCLLCLWNVCQFCCESENMTCVQCKSREMLLSIVTIP